MDLKMQWETGELNPYLKKLWIWKKSSWFVKEDESSVNNQQLT